MNIFNPVVIIGYVTSRFPSSYRLAKGGEEILINSIFTIDSGYHLSINTSSGLWQDFKSGEKGGFAKLVSSIDNVSYSRAKAELALQNMLSEPAKKSRVITPKIDLSDYEPLHEGHTKAFNYLTGRGFENPHLSGIFYARKSLPKSRFAITFKANEKVFFYQTRSLDDKVYKPKYLNCPGIPKKNVLFPFKFSSSEPLVVCEGVLDALSLQNSGINATCTLGAPSKHQVVTISSYNGPVVLSYDTDEAGEKEKNQFVRIHRRLFSKPLFQCVLPAKYGDWNKAYVAGEDMKELLKARTESLDSVTVALNKLNSKSLS